MCIRDRVYLVLVLTFGFTLLTSDIAIGCRTHKSAVGAYAKLHPNWRFLGFLTVSCIMIFIYGFILFLCSRVFLSIFDSSILFESDVYKRQGFCRFSSVWVCFSRLFTLVSLIMS